jgi:hypothetical protein
LVLVTWKIWPFLLVREPSSIVKEDVPLSFHEGPGSHTWDFWNEYLEAAIRWGVT